MEKNLSLMFKGGGKAFLSYQRALIMLHGDFISAQWQPDSIGIEIMVYDQTLKVGFHPNGNVQHFNNYQSFYFEREHYDEVLKFFKSLGFPCPQIPVMEVKNE